MRDHDPRAGHNRDDQGRILDSQGNPKEFVDPRESLLRERAAEQAAASDPAAPAADRTSGTSGAGGSDSGGSDNTSAPPDPGDDEPEPSNRPEGVPTEPPDRKYVTVGLDEHGRPDWSTRIR